VSAKVEALVAKNSKLRGSAKAVLLAIARLAPRDDGGGVYASVETIAQQSGRSVDTVQRALRKARDRDELAVYYNRGPNGTNHYQVRVDVLTRRDTNAVAHFNILDLRMVQPPRQLRFSSFDLGLITKIRRISHVDFITGVRSGSARLEGEPT
jgi:hypothetical protein